jgi:hypothetical protein
MKSFNHNAVLLEHHWFKRLILLITKPSWNMQVSFFVPSDQSNFLEFEGWKFKWFFKYSKRRIYTWIFTRKGLLLEKIPKNTKRILWVNLSAPSLGDSLMDLSGRVLLDGYEVDLLTDPKNSILYKDDGFFINVFTEAKEIFYQNLSDSYDLFILDSFSPRVLRVMNAVSSSTPFVGMWGYVNGFEVHRTIYSFSRICYLLGTVSVNKKRIIPSLKITSSFDFKKDSAKPLIAVVVGAEWEYRRYDKWADVIGFFIEDYEIVLVGSKNGLNDAQEIMHRFTSCRDFVGKCSLIETAKILSEVDVVIAADGGLWHVACALGIPTVALFAATPIFDLYENRVNRDTTDMVCETVYDPTAVKNIPVAKIESALLRLLSLIKLKI